MATLFFYSSKGPKNFIVPFRLRFHGIFFFYFRLQLLELEIIHVKRTLCPTQSFYKSSFAATSGRKILRHQSPEAMMK